MSTWRPWFAWYPVVTLGGNLVWFKTVECRWNYELNSWISTCGYSGTDGGWEYRMPAVEKK